MVGEPVDFWRVETKDQPDLLRLRAEMKMPGRAWLEWVVIPQDGGKGSLAGIFDTALDGAVAGGAGDRLAVALFGRFVIGHCFENS